MSISTAATAPSDQRCPEAVLEASSPLWESLTGSEAIPEFAMLMVVFTTSSAMDEPTT